MPYLDFSRALMSTKRAQKRPIYAPPRNIYETDADKATSLNMRRLEERYKTQNQEALQKQQQEIEAQQRAFQESEAYRRNTEEQNRQAMQSFTPTTQLPTGVYIPSGPTTSPFAPTQTQRPPQPQRPTGSENFVPTGGMERLPAPMAIPPGTGETITGGIDPSQPQHVRRINNEYPPGTGGLEPVPNNIEEIKRLSRLLAAIQGGYYGVS